MALANMGFTRDFYHAFLETPVELKVGALEINKNMLLWINDALMAVFFLLVGLEVKRELVLGSLASRQRAAFPVIAAFGGWSFRRCSSWRSPGRIRYRVMAGLFRQQRISRLPWCAGLAGKPRAGGTENLPDGAGDH